MSNRIIIQLVKYSNSEYGVISYDRKNTIRGTLRQAALALRSLGVSFAQFEFGFLDMERRGNNVAEFGILNKTFMYSHLVDIDPGSESDLSTSLDVA